jgi:hypothetical protein
LAAFAEMERSQISERTRAGMEQVRREGRARSRFIPFGYRVEGEPDRVTLAAGDRRSLIQHEPEQELLAHMQTLQEAGKGPFAISTHLTRSGVFNPRTGRPWTPGGVATILETALGKGTSGFLYKTDAGERARERKKSLFSSGGYESGNGSLAKVLWLLESSKFEV